MPSHGLKDERVRELVELAQGWGKLLAGEAFPDGPSLDVDLAGIEELTTIMQQALLKGLCEEATQRQAERLPASRACPNCGRKPTSNRPTTRRRRIPTPNRRVRGRSSCGTEPSI